MDNNKNAVKLVEAQESLILLKDGNFRHVTGKIKNKGLDEKRRATLAKGQNPYAVVLCCADSRVSPELVFDVGLGELFVVRNIGNVVSDSAIGSIEYAVGKLNCPIVLVLAHSNCGAVNAAVRGDHYTESIDRLLEFITPSVQKGVCVDEVAKAHAFRMAEAVSENKTVAESGATVIPAYYDIATGTVLWLSKLPNFVRY